MFRKGTYQPRVPIPLFVRSTDIVSALNKVYKGCERIGAGLESGALQRRCR